MNRTFSRAFPLSITLLAALLLVFVQPASAQEAGVRISPATIEETLDAGTSKQYEIEIQNLNSVDQEYFLFTRNISRVEAGGVPVFANSNLEETGFELADWVTLPFDQLIVPAGGQSVVPFQMNVPENAAPGSHFGGVFISAEPPEMESSGASVGYQVANILSIRVSGEANETATIRQFSTNRFLYGTQEVDFNVRVENAGNVLVRPSGPLEIYNSLGRKVDTIPFNDDRAGVFPGDTREFAEIKWIGDSVGFGRYEAVLSAGYGEDGARKTMSSTVSFWILPLGIIGPAAGILAVLLLITIIGVRMYIKRALAQMNAGRRMVRRKNQTSSSLSLLLIVSVLIVLALFLLVMLVLFA